MKKLFILVSALIVAVSFSCKKEGFQLYESDDYLQFTKHVNDSALSSFLALPHEDAQLFPLEVELVGHLSTTDRAYRIVVVESETTAKPENYTIPEVFAFRANRTVDTAWITLRKTPEIAVAPVRLVLRLEGSDELKVGQTTHSGAIIYISNVISQPTWWNSTVSGRFLGAYSDKKYQLFIEVTGITDLDPSNQELLRSYTIMFKNWLLREKDAGRTVYEDNGSEMRVNLLGG